MVCRVKLPKLRDLRKVSRYYLLRIRTLGVGMQGLLVGTAGQSHLGPASPGIQRKGKSIALEGRRHRCESVTQRLVFTSLNW